MILLNKVFQAAVYMLLDHSDLVIEVLINSETVWGHYIIPRIVVRYVVGTVPQAEELALRKRLSSMQKMENCTVSHYCCELYEHICGTGNGITASGTQVTAGVSVAVDPDIIPLGSVIYVDYGDGEIHSYIAEDVGGAVNGAHIDVAVETHDQAVKLGLRRATVWWEEK